MSTDAITWAFKVTGLKSSVKFVLVALADNADADSMAWPSIASIVERTSLNRKTVMKAIDTLEEVGLLRDTGLRKGTTKQVKIYQLCIKKLSIEEYQKRNSPKNGTVLNFPIKSTVFPHKEYRFSTERVPNLGHGTINEPSMNHQEPPNARGEVIHRNVEIAMLLRKLGINANGSNPIVMALAEQGVSDELLTDAVDEAKHSVEHPSLNYVVGILKRWKSSAEAIDVRGAVAPKQAAHFDWRDENAVLAKGREFGLSPGVGESWPEFKSRLSSAIENQRRLHEVSG